MSLMCSQDGRLATHTLTVSCPECGIRGEHLCQTHADIAELQAVDAQEFDAEIVCLVCGSEIPPDKFRVAPIRHIVQFTED